MLPPSAKEPFTDPLPVLNMCVLQFLLDLGRANPNAKARLPFPVLPAGVARLALVAIAPAIRRCVV